MSVIFIILSLALIATGIWILYGIFGRKNKNVYHKNVNAKKVTAAVLMVVGALSLIIVPGSIHQIDTGEIAVVKVWGEAKYTKTAGIHFDDWISKTYTNYDLKTQEISQHIAAYSLDAQTMECTINVQYRIQADNVIKINEKFGSLAVLDERIHAIAEAQAKVVLSSESAMNIIENRGTLGERFEAALNEKIEMYYIDILLCVVNNIDFSDAFEKTVEDKMIAEQEKLKAQYEKDKAIIQAEQELEVTKLAAQAKLAAAEGEADALKAIADAQAVAIKSKSIEVARMLGFEIVETVDGDTTVYDIDFTGKSAEEIKLISEYLKYVEYLEVWDGKLPTVMTDSGATIMIPTP